MSQGIKKINEYVVQNNRALVLSEDITPTVTQGQWNNISNGTMYMNYNQGALKYKAGADIKWSSLDPMKTFESASIGGSLLKSETIVLGKLAENSVTGKNICDGCITSTKIAPGSITNSLLAGGITGDKFADGSIPWSKITYNEGDLNLDIEIPDGSICARHLSEGCVTSPAIGDYQIIESKYADSSIPTRAFQESSINGETLLINNSITSNKLKSNCVNSDALAEKCVTRTKIADGEVINSKLASGCVTEDKISDGAVTLSKLSTEVQNYITTAAGSGGEFDTGILDIGEDAVVVGGDFITTGNIIANSKDKSQTITGYRVYNPVFCDVAEAFEYSEAVEEGDVVKINDVGRIVKCTGAEGEIPIGVVSHMYASCYGASEEEIVHHKKIPVGLLGRVMVKTRNSANAGDILIVDKNHKGECIAVNRNEVPYSATRIGIVLKNKDLLSNKVLCLIK